MSGTDLTRYGLRSDVVRELKMMFGGKRPERMAKIVVKNKVTAVVFYTMWLLRGVSAELLANYYTFAYVGNFPEKGEIGRNPYTRRGLRNRLTWATHSGAMDAMPTMLSFRHQDNAPKPVNAAVVPTRLDPALIAWQKEKSEAETIIPTSWIQYPTEFHSEDVWRLSDEFYRSVLPNLMHLGHVLGDALSDKAIEGNERLDLWLAMKSKSGWSRLKEVLQRQHEKMLNRYKTGLDSLDNALESTLRQEASTAFLSFSLCDPRSQRPHNVVKTNEAGSVPVNRN
jgi:hypothetical protein